MRSYILKAVLGFLAASVAAGAAQVAFAIGQPGLSSLFGSDFSERIGPILGLVLIASVLTAVFAALFAAVAIALGRVQGFHGWVYYTLCGLVIGAGGFLAQRAGEPPGAATIVNPYALKAYLASGFLGGLVYWLIAERGGARTAGAAPAPPRAVERETA